MEICVDSLKSAIVAEASGAHRIELCSCLQADGVTPSIGLLKKVKNNLRIPVIVLIRPRDGDFCYNAEELLVMEEDVKYAIQNEADGIAIGALTPSGEIDTDLCRSLIKCASGVPVTFHRAFDLCSDPASALEDIIGLGCCRLLTSGCAVDAESGLSVIQSLVSQSKGRISIMPGGGINKDNLAKILNVSGAKEFHTSASVYQMSRMKLKTDAVKFIDVTKPTVKICASEKATELLHISENVWKEASFHKAC